MGLLAGLLVVGLLLVLAPHLRASRGVPAEPPSSPTGESAAASPAAVAPGDPRGAVAADLRFRVEDAVGVRLAMRFGGTIVAAQDGPRSVLDCMARQAGAEYAAYDATSAVVRRMDIHLTNTSSFPVSGTFVLGKSRNPFVPGWFAVPGCALTLGEGTSYPNRISFEEVPPGGRRVWPGFVVYLGQRSAEHPRGRVEDSPAVLHVRATSLHRASASAVGGTASVSQDGPCGSASSGDVALVRLDAGADGLCR